MTWLLYGWPFVGLAAAVVGLGWLLLGPRPAGAPPRASDPSWLASLMLPVYALHQFEEHGFDLLGRRYQFLHEMCAVLGHEALSDCPADPWFILAVNVGGVWLAGLTAIAWRTRNPLVGACAYGIPIVNAFAHIGGAVAHAAYNAGLFTSVVLFLPLGAYVVRTFVREGLLRPRSRIVAVFASGGLLHVILIGGLEAYAHGLISETVMCLVQVGNGLVPLAVGTLVGGRSKARPGSPR